MSEIARSWVVWTSELSPFGLKVVLLARHAGLPVRVLPGAGVIESWKYFLRRARLVSGRLPLTFPKMTPDDEFPAVPYLFGPDGENLYDSTAIASWLDRRLDPDRQMIPSDPAAAFLTRLIDDYADEFGLYMAHHNRWVVSARDNDAGERVGREFRFLTGPAHPLFGAWFARRQVRRLPYLFSVAPEGFAIDGLSTALTPPSRPGFPPTHELLDDAFERLVGILEELLARRPFVLGERLTLADASLYGQLGMNLSDPSANRLIRELAPDLHGWLESLHQGDEGRLEASGPLRIDAELRPLIAEICRVHVPLMRQNAAACAAAQAGGERVFNEAAFDAGRALYDGEIDGRPYRSVAKTFQAKVWSDCIAAWRSLSDEARAAVAAILPAEHGLTEEAGASAGPLR